MARFKYTKAYSRPNPADPSPEIHLPLLPITIKGTGGETPIDALVDTGALVTLLPLVFWADIIPDSQNESGTLYAANNTPIPVLYATVEFELDLAGTVYTWKSKVGFSDARSEAVLGDAGFLRYFPVTFYRSRKYFIVRPPENLPPMTAP